MRFHRPLSVLSLLAALALPGLAAAQHLDNPFVGAKFYVNPDFTANANSMAAQESDSTLATRMRLVGQQNTAVWMDKIGAVSSLAGHLDAALTQGANLFLGVVYDLPGRDCHALASNGELPNSAAGLTRYKSEYIDAIYAIVSNSKYAGLRIVFVVEPDSLPNLVTNMDDPDCAQAAAAVSGAPDGVYIEGVRYAVNKLHSLSNVYLYIDAGHSGWLGWTDKNFPGWITMMGKVATGFTAGKNAIEGFADDTANTLPTKEPYLAPGMTIGGTDIKQSKWLDWNPYPDEQSFCAEMYSRFVAAGWPSSLGIIHDTSRNGWGGSARPTAASTSTAVDTYVNASKVDRRGHRGLWCNPLGAGIGALPTAAPSDWPSSHFDAYVWVKPPGESDGSSKLITDPVLNPDGKGFDQMCDPTYMTSYNVLTGATPDAPVSGAFFPAQFRTLVQNIFPIPGAPATCQSLPGTPTNLTAKPGSGASIGLTWTGVSSPTNCSVTYSVHRSQTYGFTPSSSTLVASGLTTTSYTVTGLTPSATYYFVVQAVDSLGATSSSQIQANPSNAYLLTVSKTGTGAANATVSGSTTISCGSTCSGYIDPGVTVTLTANPGSGTFTGWSGDCTGSSTTCTVIMSTGRTVSAAFTAGSGYTLSVTKGGTGSGTVTSTPSGVSCGSTCSSSYSSGTAVTLTAAAASGSQFTGWSGACTGSSATCVVTMTAAQSVSATFALNSGYTLSVTTSGSGTVTSSPSGVSCGTTCSASFSSGAAVTLTANPGSGTFTGWSGACTGTSLTCVVTMTADRSVSAAFSSGGSTPVAQHGRLKVCGTHICDASGNQVQLKGMSLFWSNTYWGGERFFNASAIQNLYSTWGATVVRAPLGVEGGGSYVVSNDSKNPIDPSGNLARITTVIDAAIATGIYVIVDWHYSSATVYQTEAQAFFQQLATKYASVPNIIWEPYNEPTTNSWSSLKSYHEAIIQTIRAAGSQNLVVVGTPTWSQDVDVASQNPVVDSASNVAYTLHFYAGTHTSWLRDKANTAMSRGVALFVTEWGTCDASGDGNYSASESTNWTNWMDQNKISSANWSLNDKAETASALVSDGSASATGPWPSSQLTQSGAYVKAYIGATPTTYSLTVTKAGTGSGTVSGGSIACGSTCSASYNPGTVVTLTAAASSGSTFGGWGGACSGTGTTCVVTMSAAQSVSATFNGPSTYTLTVVKSGTGTGTVTSSSGGISCGSSCSASYTAGTVVTLTAVPGSGSTFTGFSSCAAAGTTCAVTVSGNITVTAAFSGSSNATLTISKSGAGTGTVTSSSGGISCGSSCSAGYTPGTVVTLTATPSSGSTFGGFTGCTASGNTCVLTVTSNTTVTATFSSSPTGGCHVVYTLVNQWDTGFQGSLSIQNTSSSAWSSWTVTFSLPGGQTITQIWGATATQSGGVVTANNVSWNASIPAGATYSGVGFLGNRNGGSGVPTSFTVNGITCN